MNTTERHSQILRAFAMLARLRFGRVPGAVASLPSPGRVNALLSRLNFVILTLVMLAPRLGPLGPSLVQAEKILFAPTDSTGQSYVPLSEFQAGIGGGTLTFRCNPNVLRYYGLSTISVASRSFGTFYGVQRPTTVDLTSGLVTLADSGEGTLVQYVVVSTALTNDFPLQTHWSNALDAPLVGAHDGLGSLALDASGQWVNHIKAPVSEWPASPYYWDTSARALFSTEARVPGYFEGIGGRGFHPFSIPNEVAIWLSDQITSRSERFPVVYRNFYSPSGQPLDLNNLLHNQPVFQVLWGYRVAGSYSINGRDVVIPPTKVGVTSFLLPPYWSNASPPRTYPILFNSAYGNSSFFSFPGTYADEALHAMADLYVTDPAYKAIGVMTNAGDDEWLSGMGADHAAHDIFAISIEAAAALGGDRSQVVTFGASRGGITALAAANPYWDNYTVKYAIAYHTAASFGEWTRTTIGDFCHPAFLGVAPVAGYHQCWHSDWSSPEFPTGLSLPEVVVHLTTGLIQTPGQNDSALYDAMDKLMPWDDSFVHRLVAMGTRVHYRLSTLDSIAPSGLQLRYVDKLRQAGVPTRLDVVHREGHTVYGAGFRRDIKQAVLGILTNIPFDATNHHYSTDAVQDTATEFSVPDYPTSQPIWFDIPMVVYPDRPVNFTVTGGAGQRFRVQLWSLDQNLQRTGVLAGVWEDTLPAQPSPGLVRLITEKSLTQSYPTSVAGSYEVVCGKASPDGSWVEITRVAGDEDPGSPLTERKRLITTFKALEESAWSNIECLNQPTAVSSKLFLGNRSYGVSEK